MVYIKRKKTFTKNSTKNFTKYKPKYKFKVEYRNKIRYYHILFKNRALIMKNIANYMNLRKEWNKNTKYRYIFPRKFKFTFNRERLLGILKIPGWKKKTRNFHFLLNENQNDVRLYDFWDLQPSYLKYVYSKINRMHPYKQIYNLAYRAVLLYPYSLIIKPYTIILKNYNFDKFFLILEWSNKFDKLRIIMKIIYKRIKYKNRERYSILDNFHKKINEHKTNNILYNILYGGFYQSSLSFSIRNYFLVNYDNYYSNKLDVILTRKRIRDLWWYWENWLWRLRANWKFVKVHKYKYSKKFKNLLLDKVKLIIENRNYFEKLPVDIFMERFSKIFVKELFSWKFINLSNRLRNNGHRFVSSYNDKNRFFKSRGLFMKKFSLNITSFYSRLYYIYFFWVIFFISKMYIYINKIVFNLWMRFLNITSFLYRIDNLYDFFTLNIFTKNILNNYCFFNYESYFLKGAIKMVNYFHVFEYYYKYSYNNSLYKKSYYNFRDSSLIRNDYLSYFPLYFYNFCNINYLNLYTYYFRCSRTHKNQNFYSVFDYFEINNYTIINNFKDHYLQTFRFISETPRGVLKNLKENDNRINYDKIYLTLKTRNFDQLRYTSFELGIYEDKRMYFL